MASEWKKREGVVYSTNPSYTYGKEDSGGTATLPPEKQKLLVLLDKKQRKGKPVTLVRGFQGSNQALEELGRWLKIRCGVGGSAKEGEILIQGDQCVQVMDLLREKGYAVKRSGG